jgi:hypothetical protein
MAVDRRPTKVIFVKQGGFGGLKAELGDYDRQIDVCQQMLQHVGSGMFANPVIEAEVVDNKDKAFDLAREIRDDWRVRIVFVTMGMTREADEMQSYFGPSIRIIVLTAAPSQRRENPPPGQAMVLSKLDGVEANLLKILID